MHTRPTFFVLVAVGLICLCVSCSRPTQNKEEVARQKIETSRQQVLQMASKHDADLKWLTILGERDLYTIELQQALLQPSGRSRMLLASVVDVLQREDGYFLTAHHESMNDIYFQLQCTAEQAQYVLKTSANHFRMYADYAIVFSPKSVHKPVAQLVGEIDVDFAHVVHEVSDIVIVKGTCVDLLSLGNSRLDIDDLLTPASKGKR